MFTPPYVHRVAATRRPLIVRAQVAESAASEQPSASDRPRKPRTNTRPAKVITVQKEDLAEGKTFKGTVVSQTDDTIGVWIQRAHT